MPGRTAFRRLAGGAALLLLALGGTPAPAADSLVIDGDGTVRAGSVTNGLVVAPSGTVRLGATAAPPLTVDGANVSIGSSLNFGKREGQLLTLWEPRTGIGVQNSTLYFRSYGNFAWFDRGNHASERFAPGEGGTVLMTLSSSPLAGRGTLDVGGSVSAKSLSANDAVSAATLAVTGAGAAKSFDIRTVARSGSGHPTVLPSLYVTGDFPDARPAEGAAPGVEFRHSNGTQGIGFGYNTIYATGSNTDQPLRLQARGASNVAITGNGNLEVPGTLYLGNEWTVTTSATSLAFSRNGKTIMGVNDGERLQYNVPGLGFYFLGNGYDSIGYRWATWDSDARLKADIAVIPGALDRVRALRGVTFHWNDRAHARRADLSSGLQVGVIAQEVEAVLPEAVSTNADGYKAVEYRDLVPLLIQALKEQDAIATEQAARIAALEADLAAVRAAIAALAAPGPTLVAN
jgi:hypothetical protein